MKKGIVAALGVLSLGLLAAVPANADVGLPSLAPTPGSAGGSGGSGSGGGGTGNSAAPSSPSTGLCTSTVTGASSTDATGAAHQYGPQGSTVTVSGAGFATTPVCSLTAVKVGAATIDPSAVTLGANGTSLSFTLPAGASGPVSVVQTEAVTNNQDTSNNNVVFIETPTAVVDSANPVAKTVESVSGTGFSPFMPATAGGLPGAGAYGTYAGCPGGSQSKGATVASDAALQLGAPDSYCDGQLTMVFSAPADTNRPMDCTHPAPAANCIQVPVDAGAVDVFFFVQSLQPKAFSTVHPGDVIHVTGSGFGPAGAADLSGVSANVKWSDTSLAITVPSGASTGVLTVQRATGDLQSVQLGAYLVPGTTGTVGPPGTPIPGLPGGPIVGPNGVPVYPGLPVTHATGGHGVLTPSSTPAVRDSLTLSLDTPQAPAGGTVHYIVTLSVNGKPVSGAPVTVKILSAPGSDAKLSAPTGVTDAKGVFKGRLTLSQKPGDHLLLAVSGIYSDEAHVVGQPPSAASGGGLFGIGGLKIHITGNPVVVWLSVATAILVLFGILVNIEVLRRVLWSLTLGRLLHRRKTARGPA